MFEKETCCERNKLAAPERLVVDREPLFPVPICPYQFILMKARIENKMDTLFMPEEHTA